MVLWSFCVFFLPVIVLAQTQPAAPRAGQGRSGAPVKNAKAVRASEAPLIDGLLDERVWQQATPTGDFTQTEPSEGQPATEKTEVRVLYDDKAVYIGVICYDSDPAHIVTTDSRRDSSPSGQDAFQIIFDTYHDR